MQRDWDLGRLRREPARRPARVHAAEPHEQPCRCRCWVRGWEAGARAERERIERESVTLGLVLRLLAWAVLLLGLLLLPWWLGERG